MGLLLLLAAGNALVNNLFLSQYVQYGYWYRVPDVLAVITLVGVLAQRAAAGPRPNLLGRGLAVAVLLVGLGASWSGLRPRTWDPASTLMARGAVDAARSLDQRLPAGTLVGSWNAGVVGWLTERAVVVNLDGLANRPDFVPIAAQEVLFRVGLADELRLLDWLDARGIRYLVDLHGIDDLDAPFYGVIPTDRYRFVLSSGPVDHWNLPPGSHAVTLVELTPAPAPPITPMSGSPNP